MKKKDVKETVLKLGDDVYKGELVLQADPPTEPPDPPEPPRDDPVGGRPVTVV